MAAKLTHFLLKKYLPSYKQLSRDMITPDTIEKIMDAARIEEVVSEFVTLRKRGVNLIGLCPFHNEKTPSFNVSPPKGIFKCFGCGKGGNAVNFLMEHEHFSYPEALKYLARKYSIEIEEEKPSPEQQEAMDEKESLFNLTSFAQQFFEKQLHETEEGKSVGLTYLKERGFSLEVIKKFGLGYCPSAWDTFSKEALKQGYKKDYLLKTSLSKSKDHVLYDTFRGRVIFPIHNLSGRVLGFGGRIMTADKKRPKYINSAESEIYHKSKALYGIYFAKSPMASHDNCYLVEGYTDVTSLHQAGIHNVIATSGTALTPEQVKLIRRYTSNVTLLYDGDPAGVKAAFRSTDIIVEEGLNVRIVLFPEGEDPDSFARKKRPSEVKAFVEDEAADFISFKTRLLLKETRDDPIKKAGLIKEIAGTIALIPEPIARTIYVQKCSTMMEVEEKLLVAEVSRLRRQKFLKEKKKEGRPDQDVPPPPEEPPESQRPLEGMENNDSQEKELIRLLLNYASQEMTFEVENEDGRMEEMQMKVVEFIVDDIRSDQLVFDNSQCQQIFDAFAGKWAEKEFPGNSFFTDHEDAGIRQLAIDLMTSPHTLSKNWEYRHRIYIIGEEDDLKPRVLHAVYAFKLKKLEKMIRDNQQKIRELGQQEEKDEEALIQLMEAGRDLMEKRKLFAGALNRVVTK